MLNTCAGHSTRTTVRGEPGPDLNSRPCQLQHPNRSTRRSRNTVISRQLAAPEGMPTDPLLDALQGRHYRLRRRGRR